MNERKILLKSNQILAADTEGAYKIWANTKQLDHQGQIVEPSAFKNIAEYLLKYPRIFYGHAWAKWGVDGEESLPIGKAVDAEINEQGLILWFTFSGLPFAQKIKYLVDNNFPLFASIGGFVKDSYIKDKIEYITDFHLIETSIVTVPANDGAEFIKGLKNEEAKLKVASIMTDLSEYAKLSKSQPNGGIVNEKTLAEKNKYIMLATQYQNNKGLKL